MLSIWGRISSINVRKVVWCAQELDLSFERTDAGGRFGGLQTAAFQSLNPNALIPLIRDDDVTLWESNVIVRYLCAKHAAGSLYPIPLPERFDAERWMDWQQTMLNPAGSGAFKQWIRTPAAERDPAVIARSTSATEPLFGLVDAHLATHRFMLGNAFSMADIPLGCEAHRWFGLPADYVRPAWPHLERWFGELRERAGARGVLDLALE